MLVLHVTVQVKPEHLPSSWTLARYNAGARRRDEPGCLRFDIVQDRDDPNCFRFYEVYRDDAALAAHRETPHFKQYFETTPAVAGGPPAERRLGTLDPADELT